MTAPAPAAGPAGLEPAQQRDESTRRLVVVSLVAALLAGLAFAAFVLAPVDERQPVYGWSSVDQGGSTSLALLTGRPDSLLLDVPCDTLRSAGGTVLSTVPFDRGDPRSGLLLTARDATATVAVAGVAVLAVELPEGCDAVRVVVSADGATASVDAQPAGTAAGDLRPATTGFYVPPEVLAQPDAGDVRATAVADDRFDSSPTLLKLALGTLAVLAVAVALLAAVRVDRRRGRRVPRGWGVRRLLTPRPVDVVVAVVLLGWAVAGPTTVDDGYIATMLRNRPAAGFIGNYFRWFNAPEAPFGWFYEPMALWARASTGMTWLRLPSVALGLLTWLMLSRLLLPRVAGLWRRSGWVGAAAPALFLLWWLPYDSGVRPEPWIALGTVVVLVLLERGLICGTVSPIALAGFAAAWSVGVGPTGVIAVAPLLARAPALVRLLLRWSPLERVAAVAAVAAAAATAVLAMFGDQTLGTVLEATRVRQLIGPNLSWPDEYIRYSTLLMPEAPEGTLTRRLPVLLCIVAVAGVLAVTGRARGGPARRARALALTTLLAAAALAFTPTKWTHHFGAFAAIGTLLGVAALGQLARRRPDDARGRLAATAAVAIALAVAAWGWNNWWYLSSAGVLFGDRTPSVGLPLASVALVVGLAVAGLAARTVSAERRSRWPAVASAVLVTLVVLEVATFEASALTRSSTYSVARAGVDGSVGEQCPLEDALGAELDTTLGRLAPSGALTGTGFRVPSDPDEGVVTSRKDGEAVGLTGSVPASTTGTWDAATSWYDLPPDVVAGALPVLLPAAAGAVSADLSVVAELRSSRNPSVVVARIPIAAPATTMSDTAIDVTQQAAGADQLRVLAFDGSDADGAWVSIGYPRVPVTTPLSQVIPRGVPTAVDWRSAFYLQCTTPAPISGGVTTLPDFVVTSELGLAGTASLGFSRAAGGAYVPTIGATSLEPLPVFMRGDPLRDAVRVFRVRRDVSAVAPLIEVRSTQRPGWLVGPPIEVPAQG